MTDYFYIVSSCRAIVTIIGMNKKESIEASGGLSRREFMGLSVAFCIPMLARAKVSQVREPIKLGLITDLHHDLIHDGKNRLEAFLAHCRTAKTDGLIQMGDFTFPDEKNQDVIDLFNRAHETTLHVIGNHDTDNGHTKQQCIDRWGMPARYYARKVQGIWLIVLDGNDTGSPDHKGGYPAYIGPEQVAWLKNRLQEIKEPIIIVSHQPLIGALAVDNAAEVPAPPTGLSSPSTVIPTSTALSTKRKFHTSPSIRHPISGLGTNSAMKATRRRFTKRTSGCRACVPTGTRFTRS